MTLETAFDLPFWFEFAATVTGGLSGGMSAVRARYDIFGTVAIACITGMGGGIIRDILLQNYGLYAFQSPWFLLSCALAGVAVLYTYLFLFTDRDMAALSVVIAQSDRFEEACDLIARTAKLSKREAEILPLALRGRTAERIAGEFFISKNTVDTHLRRIYAKCGVHTRQELIDLGERTEAEL